MESWPSARVPGLPGRGPTPHVRDTSTGQLRPVGSDGTARMYVCGITPYDATHIGHAATYVAFDTLHRALLDAGSTVRYAQNVTDVDDPLLDRARDTDVPWQELAERETELFRGDMTALRVLPPHDYVGAVEAVPRIVEAIIQLIDRGATYTLDGDVYFSLAGSGHLGKISNLDRAEMVRLSAERGGDPDRPGKKDPLDPLLWLAARPGEPSWPAPFGPGRPGWHVECCVISLAHLGPVVDVLGGGSDLAFPHHDLGACTESALTGGWPVARAVVHTGMVGLDGEKMSKSLGNLVFVSRLLAAGTPAGAVRLALLANHYAGDWEWRQAGLDDAAARLARWSDAVGRPAGPPAEPVLAAVRERLAADLDAPGALAVVDRWVEDSGADAAAPGLVRDLADALLGVRL